MIDWIKTKYTPLKVGEIKVENYLTTQWKIIWPIEFTKNKLIYKK